ncbi:hypothetical protein KUCAC02_005268, partial [Chaenocephalus aceratus]
MGAKQTKGQEAGGSPQHSWKRTPTRERGDILASLMLKSGDRLGRGGTPPPPYQRRGRLSRGDGEGLSSADLPSQPPLSVEETWSAQEETSGLFEGGADGPSVQRGVGSVRYSSGCSRHGASVCTPPAPHVHPGQPGAGLHRSDGRGLPPAAAHAGRPASPGDSGSEREQADQSRSEGADRRPE